MSTARTNLGPLTTPFSYPAHCTAAVGDCSSCNVFWQAQTCSNNGFNSQGVQDDPQCWPARQNPNLSTGVALNGWGFYSPGISCPSGYATSCVATGSVDGGFPFQFPLLDSETAAGCCPTGFYCRHEPLVGQPQTCYSVVTTGSFPVVGCSSGTSNDFHYYNVPATVTQTIESPGTSLTTTLISAMTTSTMGSTITIPESLSSQSPSPSPSAGVGLSSGAKAGVGVGAGIGGLLILAAIIFFCVRRRRASNPASELVATEIQPALIQQHIQPAELPPNSYYS
ncbi:hypothetical protein GGS24DRAFT_511232 [Hypoxylon argillaceum]|nr:hypothetical protein GGS24DRAFT_511232 [Hypoxylon argillaceum]